MEGVRESHVYLIKSTLFGVVFSSVVMILMYVFKIMKILESRKKDGAVIVIKARSEKDRNENVKDPERFNARKDTAAAASIATKKKKNTDNRWTNRTDKQGFSHSWLLTSLKGHTGQVLDMDFASNGKYLASCAEDRTVVLWDIKDLQQKDRKSLRVNVEFDHPTMVKWSPDSKAFIITKYSENTVEVYKVEKKKDSWIGHPTKAFTFPKAHVEDIIALGIACNGKYIMTCSNKTNLIIWDLKGQELARVDTYLMSTFCAKISPCGKFIVASGFAPDVKVWEVIFTKTGEFQEVKRVFELSGHTSGVYDVAFDADTSHIATISKDKTWKVFNTKIEYKKGEDPHMLRTGSYEQGSSPSKIALSPNAEVVVVATLNTLAFYSALTGELDYRIENIYGGNITSLSFDSLGQHVFLTGDKHIRVFHNVTGYRCAIVTAKDKLKHNQTSATKERLQKIIADSEDFLLTIEAKA